MERLSFKDETKGLTLLDQLQIRYSKSTDQVIIKVPSSMDTLPIIDQCRDLLEGFEVINGTMDDAFIGITGKEIRE